MNTNFYAEPIPVKCPKIMQTNRLSVLHKALLLFSDEKRRPFLQALYPPYTMAEKKTLHPRVALECCLVVLLLTYSLLCFQVRSRPRGAAWESVGSSTVWCGSPASSGIWAQRWPPCWTGWSASSRRRRSSTPCCQVSGWSVMCFECRQIFGTTLMFFFILSRYRGGPDVAGVSAGSGQRHRPPLVCLPEPLGWGGETPGAGFTQQAAGVSPPRTPFETCKYISRLSKKRSAAHFLFPAP